MIKHDQAGFAGAIVAVVLLGIGLVGAVAFGVWAFIGMQENKSDLDAKIEAASAVAVEKAETAKETEFAEREKDPFASYSGSATYGSLGFRYPKTWSVYAEEKPSGTVLDLYAHPRAVAGISKENSYALRVQILSSQYASEAAKIQRLVDRGSAAVTAFRAKNVPDVLGLRATGEIVSGKQGAMVMLPQRDKTFVLWTEQPDFVGDFDKVIESLTFVP